ncbi:MAG: carbon-nitrogen hydrolase family protein [Terriglobia bacterium]
MMRSSKFTRRGFLGKAAGLGLGGLALPAFPGLAESGAAEQPAMGEIDPRGRGAEPCGNCAGGCAPRSEAWKSTSDQPPRKVILGTVMQPFWGKYPGLEKRLAQLTELVNRMGVQSQKRYGRGIDLAILPEVSITGQGESVGDVAEWAFPLEGPVEEAFARTARQHHSYIVAPLYLLEDKATKRCSNAAVLFGRRGEVVGIYRKVHPVVEEKTGAMEHGCTPGKDVPVFECDFGKLGIQICYDMNFNSGWRELARKGAEIVAWPSQTPKRAWPTSRAIEGHYYIVSSTWQVDACVFDPVGKIVSQVEWTPSMGPHGAWNQPSISKLFHNNTLVEEIDLSYAILPYSRSLEKGALVSRTFGDKAGFRYYDDEERGIFWSNDRGMTIHQMAEKLNQIEEQVDTQEDREFYLRAGVPMTLA